MPINTLFITFKFSPYFAFILSIFIALPTYATEPKKQFESAFATAVILTDNESITLGVGNFSPEKLLNLDDDNSDTDAAINRRNELSTLSLPYTWQLNDEANSDTITAQLAYIEQSQHFDLEGEQATTTSTNTLDISTDHIYTLELSYNRFYALDKHWLLRYGMGAYVMHYKNDFTYNTPFSRKLKPIIDGVYFNTSSNAFIVEPQLKATYTNQENWGKWQYINNIIAFTGSSFSGVESSKNAHPSGWRMNNTVKIHYDINRAKFHAESFYLKLQRSDIGGDMVGSLATKHFYELGLGLLLSTKKFTSLADNIGIGININRGSSLSGGSIVFYFNEL